jgi:hypothetical protein
LKVVENRPLKEVALGGVSVRFGLRASDWN